MSQSSAGLRHTPKAFSPVVENGREDYLPEAAPINAATNVLFQLKEKRKGNVYYDLYGENIINPTTKKLDTIRVLKGIYTIWKSEQDEQKLEQKTIQKSRVSVVFENNGTGNNLLVIQKDKFGELKIEALRLLNDNMETAGYNKGSKFAYFEINTERIAEQEAAKRAKRREAIKIAGMQKDDVMKKHAGYLRIHFLDNYGIEKSLKTLRNDYEDYAERFPEKFLQSVNSPEIEVAYLIRKAVADAKIDTTRQKGSAYWGTGAFICKVPQDRKPHDYLLEFAMLPTEEGKDFLEKLKTVVT